MKKTRHTEEQIAFALKQAETGTAAGGTVETTMVDFEPNVVVDGKLVTGRNPRSDHPIAKALVDALGPRHA